MKNPNKLLLSVFILVAAMVLQGCGDDDAPAKPIVYAAGYKPIAGNDFWGAFYSKNGELTTLEDGADKESIVNAIAVYGKDVYMAGYKGQSAVYWKNDELITVPLVENTEWNSAREIVVTKNDVHMVLYTSSNPVVYWKNGAATKIPCTSCYPTDLAISGNDVYIAGYNIATVNGNDIWQAGYWKNGVWNGLLNPESSSSYGEGIQVVGSDIYIVGSYYRNGWHPAYWKNGELTELGDQPGYANDIEVVNGKVYATGNIVTADADQAAYWKDGVVTVLADDASDSYSYDLAVKNGRAYVIGEKMIAGKGWTTLLWVDGELTAPFDGSQVADFGHCYTLLVK